MTKAAKTATGSVRKPDSDFVPLDPGSEAVARLVSGQHDDPFGILGLHKIGSKMVARCFLPGARAIEVQTLAGKGVGALVPVGDAGLFEGVVSLRKPHLIRFHATGDDTSWQVVDPYSFGPLLGAIDDHLFREGRHLRLFDRLGAHPETICGVEGTRFAVWAPNAKRVSVVGDFNYWDGRVHVMRLRHGTGVWELFLPGVARGASYKFEILGPDGALVPQKADPFAFGAELRPATASVVTGKPAHDWGDAAHLQNWRGRDMRALPMAIYEVHAGSWRRTDGDGFLTWDEMADQLIPYAVEMGFTHIEFLPVCEHPYDPSWGYQTTGLYAPSARFGEPEGFARFVDGAHRAGLGVFVDWVPAHFPLDAHGLARFDGTHLYEHADQNKGFHPDWKTAIYNFGRTEVRSFLVNNALYWAEMFHVDGLRVDAVASMLYLDYSRKDGEWQPNIHGGRENLEAVEFLKDLNRDFYGAGHGIVTIAEESTAWPGVTTPVHDGGLGFGFKWNMGFMNDTLRYMAREPVHRKFHHNEMTFGIHYGFSENFVLPLSHDEVVHGKGSLLSKMPGDDWQKFASLRAYYGFMWGHPGKKLLFMGQEFAQREEWTEARSLDWHLLDAPAHRGVQTLVRDLNRLYRAKPALHARDCDPGGFEWRVGGDSENSVFAWLRMAPGEAPVLVVSNMTPVPRDTYVIYGLAPGEWHELLNTDAEVYGGSGKGNQGKRHANAGGQLDLTLPPLGTLFLEHRP